jgi:hypothetical protein
MREGRVRVKNNGIFVFVDCWSTSVKALIWDDAGVPFENWRAAP